MFLLERSYRVTQRIATDADVGFCDNLAILSPGLDERFEGRKRNGYRDLRDFVGQAFVADDDSVLLCRIDHTIRGPDFCHNVRRRRYDGRHTETLGSRGRSECEEKLR